MTYSRVREVVREAMHRLGEKPDDYGLHSFRAGGATAAANAGVEDRLFKRHGRLSLKIPKMASYKTLMITGCQFS